MKSIKFPRSNSTIPSTSTSNTKQRTNNGSDDNNNTNNGLFLSEDDRVALRSIISTPRLFFAPPEPTRYTVCLMPGAGSTFELMARMLLARPNWVHVNVDTTPRKQPCCDRLQQVNVFLGEKLVVEMLLEESDNVRKMSQRKKIVKGTLCQSNQINGCGDFKTTTTRGNTPQHTCLVNYYRGTRDVTLKDRMLKAMRHAKIEWYCPQTFILTPHAQHDDRLMFLASFQKLQEPSLWIVKSSHGKGGEGHKIVRNPKDALKYVDSQKSRTPWIVQRYIDAPFLVKNRKFDMRAWVLVTGDFCIYMYKEGVLRTSSEVFSLEDVSNRLVHLTNHCVQMEGPNYSCFEQGNEMFFSEFQQYLDTLEPRRSFVDDVLPVMRTMIVHTLLCVQQAFESQCISPSPTRAFQFFGFDFMLDDTFQLWLLEVNGAPAIAQALSEKMVQDILSLTIDSVFSNADGNAGGNASTNFDFLYPRI